MLVTFSVPVDISNDIREKNYLTNTAIEEYFCIEFLQKCLYFDEEDEMLCHLK